MWCANCVYNINFFSWFIYKESEKVVSILKHL
jgi:hypothetical protein